MTLLKQQTKDQENIPGALVFSFEQNTAWCENIIEQMEVGCQASRAGAPVTATAIRAFPLIPAPDVQSHTPPPIIAFLAVL